MEPIVLVWIAIMAAITMQSCVNNICYAALNMNKFRNNPDDEDDDPPPQYSVLT